jgi:hypothetical protein
MNAADAAVVSQLFTVVGGSNVPFTLGILWEFSPKSIYLQFPKRVVLKCSMIDISPFTIIELSPHIQCPFYIVVKVINSARSQGCLIDAKCFCFCFFFFFFFLSLLVCGIDGSFSFLPLLSSLFFY